MERGILLPRTVEIEVKGKRKTINSYDESFRGSAEYYGFSMSKYLATLRHFPEVTELGKELKLGNWKQNIFDILTSEKESKKFGVNKDWADYLRLTLETHLGMESATTSRINKKNLRWMGTLSSTGAAVATGGASIAPQAAVFAGGRMIDAVTGRRSKVRRYIAPKTEGISKLFPTEQHYSL